MRPHHKQQRKDDADGHHEQRRVNGDRQVLLGADFGAAEKHSVGGQKGKEHRKGHAYALSGTDGQMQ